MKKLFSRLSWVAFVAGLLTVSCQHQDSIVPTVPTGSARAADVLAADPTFYSIAYQDHGNLTVNQYLKRARKSGINPYSYGSTLLSAVAQWPTNSPSPNREDLKAALTNPAYYPKYVFFNNKNAVVFRGGNSFTPSSSSEYRFASPGVVRGVSGATADNPARGISLEVNYKCESRVENDKRSVSRKFVECYNYN